MKVTANMATVPERLTTSTHVIDSIYDQVSLIRIYLNNFEDTPQEFIDDKIHVFQGEDLQSSGKVFWAKNPDEYYFCIDDDIHYPSDYVKYTLSKLNEYDDDVVISHHGRIFPRNRKIRDYFRDRAKYLHFSRYNPEDTPVDVIGNGVSCWNTNRIKIDVTKFKYYYMDDILVSAQALEQGKERIVISHKQNYLRPLKTTNIGLCEKYENDNSVQTKICNSIKW